MIDKQRPLDSFSGVGANQTATVALPGGVVYDALHLEYNYGATDFNPSHITAIRLNLNGEAIVDVTAQDLIDVETYKGISTTNGYLTIQLAEIVAKTFNGKHDFGLITSGSDAVSLEVDIGGATSPTLKGFAETRARPRDRNGAYIPRQYIPKMRTFPNNASAGGPFEISTLPRRPDVRYKRVLFRGQYITKVEVERDQIKVYELTKDRAEYLQHRNGKTPISDTFMFDPIKDGWAKSKLFPTVSNSLIFRLEMSQAGKADALVESVWLESNPRP